MFQEKWFFGTEGTRRVCEMSDVLNQKQLNRLNSKYGTKFVRYSPWMSFENRIEYFLSHPNFIENFDSDYRIRFLPSDLDILAKGFSDDQRMPYLFAGPRESFTRIHSVPEDASFIQKTKDAIQIVRDLSPMFSQRVSHLLFEVIPTTNLHPTVPLRDGGTGVSFHRYRGGIFLSYPTKVSDPLMEFAYNIAHELGHQALMVYQTADDIFQECDLLKAAYSPVRRTTRPAILAFHALAAAAYMAEFLRLLVKKQPEYEVWAAEKLKVLMPEYKIALERIGDFKFTLLGRSLWEEFFYSIPTFERACG